MNNYIYISYFDRFWLGTCWVFFVLSAINVFIGFIYLFTAQVYWNFIYNGSR